jgi:four helix bundle protein
MSVVLAQHLETSHFTDQERRSALSILSNVAEGFERNSRKEFAQFLSIAKGSCGELRAQLLVALDQKYISSSRMSAYT